MARSSKSAKGKKGKKGSVTVNMEGVESGGRSIDDGWAHLRLKEAELTESSNENEMFAVKFEATRGKTKATVFDNFVLTPNALWKLKSFLEAAGVDVPDDEMEISAEDLIDLECDGEIVNEEYEGRDRPRIVTFRATGEGGDDDEEEDEDEEDEEEEKPSKKSKAKSKKKSKKDDDDEDEEDEEEDDDDSEEDDDDDSDDEDEDEDEDEEEEEEDEDEEEEDEPKSKKKAKGKKLRAGAKVKWKHKKKTLSGVVTSVDDDTVFVEDDDGGEWELDVSELI